VGKSLKQLKKAVNSRKQQERVKKSRKHLEEAVKF
jgi:hypothetical protein